MSCALHKIQNLTQSVECSVSQAADAALTSWCGEGFFFLSQLSVQTLTAFVLLLYAVAWTSIGEHGTFRTPSTGSRAIVWTQENMAQTRHI